MEIEMTIRREDLATTDFTRFATSNLLRAVGSDAFGLLSASVVMAMSSMLPLRVAMWDARDALISVTPGRAKSLAPRDGAAPRVIAQGWRWGALDVGDQAPMRGLVTARPRMRRGLSLSYSGATVDRPPMV